MELPDNIRGKIVEWLKCDDKIRENNNQNKELRKKKKDVELDILEFMEKVNLPAFDGQESRLRRSVTKVKSGLKKELIQKALLEYTKDIQQSSKMTDFILDKRQIVEKVKLTRTKRKL